MKGYVPDNKSGDIVILRNNEDAGRHLEAVPEGQEVSQEAPKETPEEKVAREKAEAFKEYSDAKQALQKKALDGEFGNLLR